MLCEMMGDKTAFVFGKQGCLTDTDLHTALKVGTANTSVSNFPGKFRITQVAPSRVPPPTPPRPQVLSMSKEEFSEFKENEGWEEDEEEDEDEVSRAFSYDGLPELKPSWKWLVHEAARLTLQSYGDEGAEPMEEGEEAAPNRRHLNASRVRHGQKSILSTLMKVTEKS